MERSASALPTPQGGPRHGASLAYQSARPSIFSQAMRITQSRSAAEDIVQEVFIYAWQHGDEFDAQRAGLTTWLRMLCHSRAIDYVRAQNGRKPREMCELDADLMADECPSAETAYFASVSGKALVAAMATLAPRAREMLVLHYYAELSCPTISALMEIPLGTVKTVVRRAKADLSADAALLAWRGPHTRPAGG